MQQQTEMAEMLVKRKRGIGKQTQKKGIGKPMEKKKKGIRKMVNKKKTGNNYVTKKSGSKIHQAREVKSLQEVEGWCERIYFRDGVQLGSSCVDFIEHPNLKRLKTKTKQKNGACEISPQYRKIYL